MKNIIEKKFVSQFLVDILKMQSQSNIKYILLYTYMYIYMKCFLYTNRIGNLTF